MVGIFLLFSKLFNIYKQDLSAVEQSPNLIFNFLVSPCLALILIIIYLTVRTPFFSSVLLLKYCLVYLYLFLKDNIILGPIH